MKSLIFITLLMSFGLELSVRAEENTSKPKTNSKESFKKNTKLDFEGRDVDGDLQNPDLKAVDGDTASQFDSLIKPRQGFSKEAKQSSRAIR